MKLVNNSEEFILQYNASDYTIPKGEFEVVNDNLARHILFIAKKWGKDVRDIPGTLTPEIKQEPIAVKEEIKEAVKVPEEKAPEDLKREPVKVLEEVPEAVENVSQVPKVGGATSETLPKRGRPKKDA